MKNANATNKINLKDIFKKGDIIILIVLIVAIVLSVVFFTQDKASTASIYIDGVLKYTIDLSVDSDTTILDGKMIISVRDGEIFVASSDCKEQLCTHSQPISKNGGIIVCLPNKIVIKVSSEEVDAIT